MILITKLQVYITGVDMVSVLRLASTSPSTDAHDGRVLRCSRVYVARTRVYVFFFSFS